MPAKDVVIRGAGILVVAGVLIGGGSYVIGGDDPDDVTANLWMDTSGGTCTRQASPAGYVDAAACSSIDAAYTAASCGDTVRLKGGDYGGESVSAPQKNCSADQYVTFNPLDGEEVQMTGFDVEEGDWIKLLADYTATGFPTTGFLDTNWNFHDSGAGNNSGDTNAGVALQWRNGGAADHMDHIWVEGLSFETYLIRGVDQVTFLYNDIGTGKTGQWDGKNWVSSAYNDDSGGSYTSNMAEDFEMGHNFVHDFPPIDPIAHTECMTGEWHNLYLHDNAFVDCHGNTAALFFGNDGGFATTGTNNRVINNFFENDENGSLHMQDLESGAIVTVSFNSFQATVTDALGGSIAGVFNFTGNVFSSQGTSCGIGTWRYNVMAGGSVGTCDATDSSGATTFVSEPLNLHLTNGATAESKVPVASCPAADIDGDTRPTGSGTHCDAGADERE